MKNVLFPWFLALLFLSGLLLAGSDGPLFPWVNLGGVLLLGLFARAARRIDAGGRA